MVVEAEAEVVAVMVVSAVEAADSEVEKDAVLAVVEVQEVDMDHLHHQNTEVVLEDPMDLVVIDHDHANDHDRDPRRDEDAPHPAMKRTTDTKLPFLMREICSQC